jgi:ABC-type lipoprotein release transport system permease subunit
MANSTFLRFLLLLLYQYRSKHAGIALISSLIVALLGSVLFISQSIQAETALQLEMQPDFVVQKIKAGKRVDIPVEWLEEIQEINGISSITPRVYGEYYFAPREEHFLLFGVDFFDEQSSRAVEKIVQKTDLRKFLSKEQMIIGNGVGKFLQEHYYKDFYNFKNPDGEIIKVPIYGTFDKETNIISNDMVIMPMELLRSIFAMDEDTLTDIAFNVPNEAEWDNILTKLHLLHYDIRVITKEEVTKAYHNLFNYKGGLFLVLYLITIMTFILIIYQRYAMVYSSEKREIGILRALGWSIKDVLKLKFFETSIIVLLSFISGVIAAYCYVYLLDAPLLSNLFLGSENLSNNVTFMPMVDFGLLGSIFLFFGIPFMAAVLIPVWKIAVTEPKEAMK